MKNLAKNFFDRFLPGHTFTQKEKGRNMKITAIQNFNYNQHNNSVNLRQNYGYIGNQAHDVLELSGKNDSLNQVSFEGIIPDKWQSNWKAHKLLKKSRFFDAEANRKVYKEHKQACLDLALITNPEHADIAGIVDSYLKDPDTVKSLAALKDEYKYPIFDTSEINTLTDYAVSHPESKELFLSRLKNINLKELDRYPDRITMYGFAMNAIVHPDKLGELDKIIESRPKQLSYDDVVYLLKPFTEFKQETMSLLEMEKWDGKPRFRAEDIGKLAEPYHNDPQLVKALAEKTNDLGYYTFDSADIAEIAWVERKFPGSIVKNRGGKEIVLNKGMLSGVLKSIKYYFPIESSRREFLEMYIPQPPEIRKKMMGIVSKEHSGGFDILSAVEHYLEYVNATNGEKQ